MAVVLYGDGFDGLSVTSLLPRARFVVVAVIIILPG